MTKVSLLISALLVAWIGNAHAEPGNIALEVVALFDGACIKNRYNYDNLRRAAGVFGYKAVSTDMVMEFAAAADPDTAITDSWFFRSDNYPITFFIILASGKYEGRPVQICQIVSRGGIASEVSKTLRRVFDIKPEHSEREGFQNFDLYVTQMMGDKIIIWHTYGVDEPINDVSNISMFFEN